MQTFKMRITINMEVPNDCKFTPDHVADVVTEFLSDPKVQASLQEAALVRCNEDVVVLSAFAIANRLASNI